MTSPLLAPARTALGCLALVFLPGCPIDDRSLVFDYRVGSGSSNGLMEAGAGEGNDASGAGGVRLTEPGSNGEGGSRTFGAGSGGAPAAAGEAPGGAPAGVGGSAGGTGGTGGTGSAGSLVAGSGGSPGSGGKPVVEGPCGDIDQNGVEDCDETLTKNPRFDQTVDGWAADSALAQVWMAGDSRGTTSSGSIGITFAAPGTSDAWSVAATGQCVVGWGEKSYAVGARAFIPVGQGIGNATLSLVIFGNDGCKGTFLKSVTPALLVQSGGWQVLRGDVELPPGARSVLVRLGVSKPNSQPSLNAYFDDVLFREKKK